MAGSLKLRRAIADVRKEFSLAERDHSQTVSIFLLVYAIMYTGSGYAARLRGVHRALVGGADAARRGPREVAAGGLSLPARRLPRRWRPA